MLWSTAMLMWPFSILLLCLWLYLHHYLYLFLMLSMLPSLFFIVIVLLLPLLSLHLCCCFNPYPCLYPMLHHYRSLSFHMYNYHHLSFFCFLHGYLGIESAIVANPDPCLTIKPTLEPQFLWVTYCKECCWCINPYDFFFVTSKVILADNLQTSPDILPTSENDFVSGNWNLPWHPPSAAYI